MTSKSNGIGLGTVLTMIFVVLKLTNYINWSWWWVLSPLWIPILIGLAIFIGFCIFSIVCVIINTYFWGNKK